MEPARKLHGKCMKQCLLDSGSSGSKKWREAEEKYEGYWSRRCCMSSETFINVWQFFTQNVTYFLAEEEEKPAVIAFFSKADKNSKANLRPRKVCFEGMILFKGILSTSRSVPKCHLYFSVNFMNYCFTRYSETLYKNKTSLGGFYSKSNKHIIMMYFYK